MVFSFISNVAPIWWQPVQLLRLSVQLSHRQLHGAVYSTAPMDRIGHILPGVTKCLNLTPCSITLLVAYPGLSCTCPHFLTEPDNIITCLVKMAPISS